ncbi:MAG: heavy metal translocating P-type ATPase [Hyphomonadaceae bacterium]|nr:heavy metal translocating P-type ATPase [Hyphomonadaceae bacterium]
MTDAALSGPVGCPSGLEPPTRTPGGSDYSAFVQSKGAQKILNLSVRGAKCGGCLSKIENAVGAVPGVEQVRMNLSNGKLKVAWQGPTSANTIVERVTELGYGVSAYSEDGSEKAAKREERALLISMGVAAFALANIMLLSVSVWGGHGEMGSDTRTALHAISGLIAFPVLVFSGRHFFQSAWSVLKHGRANMDVPISLALTLAFGVSVWETLAKGDHAYFDASVMLLFFLLIGRFLDARLRRQAHAAAHDLAALQNRSVNRLGRDQSVESVRAEDVRRGDTILLAAGERAVIDIKIETGTSTVDESLVTGESLPRLIQAGETLYAGTVNLDHPIRGEALGSTSDSLLADIAQMLEAGEQKRARYRQIADKAVSLYVPFVHTTAAVTLIAWLLLGAGVRDAIMVAVATLIITCPCALALAAPVAQVVASGRLFRKGIYLRSGDALERFAEVDHLVFDKTGTLTLGTPTLVSTHGDELADAAHLARASRHPLSRAIVAVAGAGPIASDVKEMPGLGVEGEIDGKRCRLGSADWVGVERSAATSGPTMWFSNGDAAPVQFLFRDQLQSDAGDVFADLRAHGFEMEILSGDTSEAVERVAAEIDISDWHAQVSPQDKVDRLSALTAADKKVLMVGDGLNDAGALAMAHASLAPGGAMDVSQSASDAVYAGGLSSIVTILNVAKRTKRVMLQNFGLAAAYNMIAVPIAVTGHVTPLIAAIAMSASSLIVTLNALRMNWGRA